MIQFSLNNSNNNISGSVAQIIDGEESQSENIQDSDSDGDLQDRHEVVDHQAVMDMELAENQV